MKHKNRKGFTIVELVIVIAVIAILAAVLIPTFTSLIDKANQSADIQAVRQMNMALAAESAIEEPEGFADVIAILSAAGYNAEDKLIPISTGHSFYWHSDHNVILLANANNDPATVVFPTDNTDLVNNFADDLDEGKLFNLEDGVSLVNMSPLELALFSGKDFAMTESAALSNVFTFPAEKTATLDLGNNTLTTELLSKIEILGTLTIKNGSIAAGADLEDYDEMGIVVGDGGKLILDGVTVTATNPDTSNPSISCWEGGTAEIKNCTFEMADGVTMAGSVFNGGTMTISESTFNCQDYEGLSFGAPIVHYGESLILTNVEVTSGRYCIEVYGFYGAGDLTINGGTYNYTDGLYDDYNLGKIVTKTGTITENGVANPH